MRLTQQCVHAQQMRRWTALMHLVTCDMCYTAVYKYTLQSVFKPTIDFWDSVMCFLWLQCIAELVLDGHYELLNAG